MEGRWQSLEDDVQRGQPINSGVPTRPCRCRSRPRPLTRNGSGFGTCEGVNLTFWGPAKPKISWPTFYKTARHNNNY